MGYGMFSTYDLLPVIYYLARRSSFYVFFVPFVYFVVETSIS